MKNHINVADIVGQALFEFGEQTTHLYERALYHGLQLVKDIALDGKLDSTKAAVLPVCRTTRSVSLPGDFIDSVRVAVMRHGEPVEVGRADRRKVRIRDKSYQPIGQGLATEGYVVDADSGRLLLPTDVEAEELMLEYICSGINPTGETCVHPYLEKPLLAYVHWQLIKKRRDYSQADKQEARREYTRAMAEAVARDGRFTSGEFLTATRAGYGIILKG